MSLEIEKKYLIGNFNDTLNNLINDFGNFKQTKKAGFWWCNNHTGNEKMLDVKSPKIQKKEIAIIKDIGEFVIPDQDFQYLRLRIINKDTYVITLKTKTLVNKIEQNTEYEFEVDKEIFRRIAFYLNNNDFIFYYNIKETWEFTSNDVKIELSKFNDLKDSYIEIETLGDNEAELTKKLTDFLEKFTYYNLKEETRSYAELSAIENELRLLNLKLSQYSKEAYKNLQEFLI